MRETGNCHFLRMRHARMKAHVEIYIRLDLDGGKTLHDVLCRFSRDSKVWSFPQAESETYQKHIGGDGGYLILKPGKGIKPALVAIATAKAKQPKIGRASCRERV